VKIFFYGPFGGHDGYCVSARAYVEMLEANGHELICRSVANQEGVKAYGPEWIARTTREDTGDYDLAIVQKAPWNQDGVCDQIHLLPEFAQAQKRAWITMFETSRWPSEWFECLRHFDIIMTPTEWQKRAATAIMQEHPGIHVVPIPIEAEPAAPRTEGTYIFYSEFSRMTHRKGLDILLRAYFQAFSETDDVVLRLKIPGHHPPALNEFIRELEKAKACFAWKKLPKIEVNRGWLTDSQMDGMYNDIDCYVEASRGEGFSIPLAKAAVRGINVIYPRVTDPSDVGAEYHIVSWGDDYAVAFSTSADLVPVITDEYAAHGMKIDTTGMRWLETNITGLSDTLRLLFKQGRNISSNKVIEYTRAKLSPNSVYERFMEAVK